MSQFHSFLERSSPGQISLLKGFATRIFLPEAKVIQLFAGFRHKWTPGGVLTLGINARWSSNCNRFYPGPICGGGESSEF